MCFVITPSYLPSLHHHRRPLSQSALLPMTVINPPSQPISHVCTRHYIIKPLSHRFHSFIHSFIQPLGSCHTSSANYTTSGIVHDPFLRTTMSAKGRPKTAKKSECPNAQPASRPRAQPYTRPATDLCPAPLQVHLGSSCEYGARPRY